MSSVRWVLNLAIFFGQLYTKLATVATESGFQKRFASFNILIAEMLKTFDQNIFSSFMDRYGTLGSHDLLCLDP